MVAGSPESMREAVLSPWAIPELTGACTGPMNAGVGTVRPFVQPPRCAERTLFLPSQASQSLPCFP